ncbi:hypothetical protein AAMO2058_000587200 [Amorphochlora amoebiformis]
MLRSTSHASLSLQVCKESSYISVLKKLKHSIRLRRTLMFKLLTSLWLPECQEVSSSRSCHIHELSARSPRNFTGRKATFACLTSNRLGCSASVPNPRKTHHYSHPAAPPPPPVRKGRGRVEQDAERMKPTIKSV